MIKKWAATGDCHSDFSRFRLYSKEVQKDPEVGIIILGDAGLNIHKVETEDDRHLKNYLSKSYKFSIYCVHGNHELRPQEVEGMHLVYDENVHGEVYVQDKWPTIKYFKDWGIYIIGDYKCAVVGGAYSVDKNFRLVHGWPWFESEQLTNKEMIDCIKDFTNQQVDFVFTHTCPICWEPTDLFISGIDQSKVDKSMELFLEELAQYFDWKIWCFGHYHKERYERPAVIQFYKTAQWLDDIYESYISGAEDYWRPKSPNYFMDDPIRQKGREELYALKDETTI